MNIKKISGYPNQFHVPPYEKLELADAAIQRIREAEGAMRAQLVRELDALRTHTVVTPRSKLTVGRRYGVFGISPYANAWRDGWLIPNHGECYLYIWTLGDDGVFYNKDAWDSYSFDPYPCKGEGNNILVEL